MNMKRIDGMTQRKMISLMKVRKMLIEWKLFKRITRVETVKNVK